MASRAKVSEIDPLGDLLAATASGDRQAFSRIYHLAGPKLFAIALRVMGRRDAAEEVLQEAFLAIWRKAGQYRAERGQPLAWMATIVRHRAIDRLRSENREPRDMAEWSEATEAASAQGGYDPLEHVTDAVRNCLEQIKVKQRKALVMTYYYGLTHEELAIHLAAPLGTVKSWVRRSLIQMKDCLEP